MSLLELVPALTDFPMGQLCSLLCSWTSTKLLVLPASLLAPKIAMKLDCNTFNALADLLSFSGKHVNGIKVRFPLSQNISSKYWRNLNQLLHILIGSLLNSSSQLERASHSGQWHILFKNFPELLIKALPPRRTLLERTETRLAFFLPNFPVSVL